MERTEILTQVREFDETDPDLTWLGKYTSKKHGNPIDWGEIRLALDRIRILPSNRDQSQRFLSFPYSLAMRTRSPGESSNTPAVRLFTGNCVEPLSPVTVLVMVFKLPDI